MIQSHNIDNASFTKAPSCIILNDQAVSWELVVQFGHKEIYEWLLSGSSQNSTLLLSSEENTLFDQLFVDSPALGDTELGE